MKVATYLPAGLTGKCSLQVADYIVGQSTMWSEIPPPIDICGNHNVDYSNQFPVENGDALIRFPFKDDANNQRPRILLRDQLEKACQLTVDIILRLRVLESSHTQLINVDTKEE